MIVWFWAGVKSGGFWFVPVAPNSYHLIKISEGENLLFPKTVQTIGKYGIHVPIVRKVPGENITYQSTNCTESFS